MDQQEYEREREYHTRLLTESMLPQLIKIAKTRVATAIRRGMITLDGAGRDTVSNLSPDSLAERYSVDACRRFIQLFMDLPLKMSGALDAKNDRVLYLSMAAPDGSTLPQEMISQLSMIPLVYEYLRAPNREDPREVLNISILETLDKYIAQQIRDAIIYWDDGLVGVDGDDDEKMSDLDIPPPSGNMMFSVPWDMTREEIVLTFENMRDARR